MTDESGPPDEGAEDRSASAQEQDAALKKLAAGEGDPLELAAVLRRLPDFWTCILNCRIWSMSA